MWGVGLGVGDVWGWGLMSGGVKACTVIREAGRQRAAFCARCCGLTARLHGLTIARDRYEHNERQGGYTDGREREARLRRHFLRSLLNDKVCII